MTGMGGIAYLDLACRSGMVRSIERHVKARKGGQGWTDAEHVVSLVMLNLAGGDCVEDVDRCWRPCLWVVSVDTGKDCRTAAGPLGLGCLIVETRFHQDDREIDFLRILPPDGRGRSEDRHCRPVSHLHMKSALSSW